MLETIFGNVISFFITERLKKSKPKPIKEAISDHEVDTKPIQINEIETYSYKLQLILDKINSELRIKLTIKYIARLIGEESASELLDSFDGKIVPRYKTLDNFCSYFGVNSDYLDNTSEQIFKIHHHFPLNPLDYWGFIEQNNPLNIYFIKNDTNISEVFMILKLNKFCYIILPKIYHLSSHVGATGARQIYELYKLILKVKSNRISFTSHILNENLFNKVYCGKKYAAFLDNISTSNYWVDDLLDFNYKYWPKEKYIETYGSEFIFAQDQIISRVL